MIAKDDSCFLHLASCSFVLDDPQKITLKLLDQWSIYTTESAPLHVDPWRVTLSILASPHPSVFQTQRPRWTQHHSSLQRSTHPPVFRFTYESHRVDFSLYLNESVSPQHAHIYTDQTLGSLEACFQILLQIQLRTQSGALIHASGAVEEGLGWLMPGPSGAGKSTAARWGGFDRVLSDEFIAITPIFPHLSQHNVAKPS